MQTERLVLPFQGTDIPILTLRPDDKKAERGQRILIIYGGSEKENQRQKIAGFWGKTLTDCGFILHCFDFRSNLSRKRFKEFGLYDRLEDVREVFRWLRSASSGSAGGYPAYQMPLSVMGVSMGGYLAALLAAENPFLMHSLILVAPAAYHDQACQPGVCFGPAFRQAISEPEFGWRNCGAFERARYIAADCLLVAYENDEIVPREIPDAYHRNIHAARNKVLRAHGYPEYVSRYEVLPGFTHRGTFDNAVKRKRITRILCDFFKAI